MAPSILLLAALALDQNEGGTWGWSCGTSVTVDGYAGGISRTYGKGSENEAYVMQVDTPERRHSITWTVHPLLEGPPPSKRPAFLGGRRESEAFATGPDYVHIDFLWRTSAVGPIWAHYWGDGVYAGADLLMSARQVRRATGKDGTLGGLSGGLASRPLLTALAGARRWTVVAEDSAGKRLFGDSFTVPRREVAEAEYRRARAAIDRAEPIFRLTHEPYDKDGVTCTDHENPAASI